MVGNLEKKLMRGMDKTKEMWFPVYTKSRTEKKVYDELTKKGITCYLPLKKVLKQWSDRKKIIEEPLIKSYLFVKINIKDQSIVLMTKGVVNFIYFSGKAAFIPQQQIDGLKMLLATDQELEMLDFEINPGTKVLIKAGPLKGMTAETVKYKGKKHIILRLDNIGVAFELKVATAFIEPLN